VAGFGYAMYFFPFQNQPFQRTLAAHISFRIKDASVNLAALAPPTGKVLYTAGGSDYLGGPFQSPETIRRAGSSGRYVIRGRVLDSAGQPVPGAAIAVDDQILYSSSVGSWQTRLRRGRPALVRAVPSEFAIPGQWEVLTAPQRVIPAPENEAVPIELTVRRLVN
jgi:hypothetical protein